MRYKIRILQILLIMYTNELKKFIAKSCWNHFRCSCRVSFIKGDYWCISRNRRFGIANLGECGRVCRYGISVRMDVVGVWKQERVIDNA